MNQVACVLLHLHAFPYLLSHLSLYPREDRGCDEIPLDYGDAFEHQSLRLIFRRSDLFRPESRVEVLKTGVVSSLLCAVRVLLFSHRFSWIDNSRQYGGWPRGQHSQLAIRILYACGVAGRLKQGRLEVVAPGSSLDRPRFRIDYSTNSVPKALSLTPWYPTLALLRPLNLGHTHRQGIEAVEWLVMQIAGLLISQTDCQE